LTLEGGRGICQSGCKKSLKVLKVEVTVIFKHVLAVFLLKLCLKKNEKKTSVLDSKKSYAIRGARARCATPPPGSASEYLI